MGSHFWVGMGSKGIWVAYAFMDGMEWLSLVEGDSDLDGQGVMRSTRFCIIYINMIVHGIPCCPGGVELCCQILKDIFLVMMPLGAACDPPSNEGLTFSLASTWHWLACMTLRRVWRSGRVVSTLSISSSRCSRRQTDELEANKNISSLWHSSPSIFRINQAVVLHRF